jgi:exosome complex component RRP42
MKPLGTLAPTSRFHSEASSAAFSVLLSAIESDKHEFLVETQFAIYSYMRKTPLSSGETAFVAAGVAAGVREDGRTPSSFRGASVASGVVPQANGSARVSLGHGTAVTVVLAAVKAEIGTPETATPEAGRIEGLVQLSPVMHMDERASRSDASALSSTELTRLLARQLAVIGAARRALLGIVPGRYCWVLHVDVLVLSDGGGNVADALALAAAAALSDTILPLLRPTEGDGSEEAGDYEIEHAAPPVRLHAALADACPVSVTLRQIGSTFVVDASAAEELCAGEFYFFVLSYD